jgi:hypothetical protein
LYAGSIQAVFIICGREKMIAEHWGGRQPPHQGLPGNADVLVGKCRKSADRAAEGKAKGTAMIEELPSGRVDAGNTGVPAGNSGRADENVSVPR